MVIRRYRRKPIRRVRRGGIIKRRRIHRPIGSGQLGKRFFKLIYFTQINLPTSLNTALVVNFDDSTNTVPDFVNVATLFHYYRVNAMKLKFIPALTAQALESATSLGFCADYVVHDINQAVAPETSPDRDTILQYDNLKVLNTQRPWMYYRKMYGNITIILPEHHLLLLVLEALSLLFLLYQLK